MKGLKNPPVRAWGHGLARLLLCDKDVPGFHSGRCKSNGEEEEEIVCQETLSVSHMDWLTGLPPPRELIMGASQGGRAISYFSNLKLRL